eukprot:gnl/TRDRNA2_/TRDRNA2_44021_c0_seq1.p1 gnl/TRDRNA2_/TRDRNA2_44021_c0~~gnl/TRDRNA2_/TRDRNA2_44021_c0_seq1.p1  ORF type:complete len:518 (-),score=73.69 gnl/TRDRNA2_/TRDRNA2_44021_c0_seq1:82-1635(-)
MNSKNVHCVRGGRCLQAESPLRGVSFLAILSTIVVGSTVVSNDEGESGSIVNLATRMIAAPAAHRDELDSTMLGKHCHLAIHPQGASQYMKRTEAQPLLHAAKGRLSPLAALPSAQRPSRVPRPASSRTRRYSTSAESSHSQRNRLPFKEALDRLSRRDALLASLSGPVAVLTLPVIAKEAQRSAVGESADRNIYKVPASVARERILITGANSGLGLESAKRLAQAGAKVILTARTQSKADAAVDAVKAVMPNADPVALVLDLASLESIRDFPAKYSKLLHNAPLDVLLLNAGVMAIPERVSTADGFEKTVGINHLGHFALVSEMMPMLRKAKHGFRIISVSSEAHRFATEESVKAAIDSNLDPNDYSQWDAYGLSKAANVLFTEELQRRFDRAGIRASAVSLHPGAVQTDLGRYLIQGTEQAEAGVPLKDTYDALPPIQKGLVQGLQPFALTVEQGANTHVFLAAGADSDGDLTKHGGKYFVDMKIGEPAPCTRSRELAAELWEVSKTLTGAKITI